MTKSEKFYQIEKINYYISALRINEELKYSDYVLSREIMHDVENGRRFDMSKKKAKEAAEKAREDYEKAHSWTEEAKRDLKKIINARTKE